MKTIRDFHESAMIINDKNVGISEIDYDKNGNLRIFDKSKKYCLVVCIQYDIDAIDNIKIGEKKNIDFNEYYISENHESALIDPTISSVSRISEDTICFNFEFENIEYKICYMNRRNSFDIELKSLKCKVYVNDKK